MDDLDNLKAIDVSDMLGAVGALPAQCREAVALADKTDLKSLLSAVSGTDVSVITVLGMGGSGIGGDIVKAIVEPKVAVPVIVNKGYELPACVGHGALVFAVSYSGETEETLASFEKAVSRGARIVAVTTGGRLRERAKELALPVAQVPAGLQPRAALGYLSLTMLVLLERIGLIKDLRADIDEMLEILERMSGEMSAASPLAGNTAKKLAGRLYGKLPVIYGSEGVPAVAALRWKCQFNENSKTPAFWNQFPELDHNEIVGWHELADISGRCCLVVLRSSAENKRIAKRVEVTLPLIESSSGGSLQVWDDGESNLARLFSLIYVGDFTSVYLALINGVDPTPVERIKMLKEKLQDSM